MVPRQTKRNRVPLTPDEREGIMLAVNSAFRKPKDLYARIVPSSRTSGSRRRQPASLLVISPRRLKGDHSTLRIILEGQRPLRSRSVRTGMGSQDPKGSLANEQPIESDQRREL